MRQVKFRAWGKKNKEMLFERDLCVKKICLSFEGSIYQYLYKNVVEGLANFELMRYSGLKDENEKELCGGDIVEYKFKSYKVVDDTWRFRLERNLVEFGENDNFTMDEDVACESTLLGNIHKNPELLK